MINDCSELFDILKLETLPLTKSQISLKFYNLKKENLEKQIIEYIYDLYYTWMILVLTQHTKQIKLSFFKQHEHIKNIFKSHLSLYIKKENQIGNLKLYKYFHYSSFLGNTIVLCTELGNTLRVWSIKIISVLTQLRV